ncbi:oligosaccharide flippase family protein [Pseudoxanthomonas sp. NC8]|nr:oligosaccharide flippase family protein [Pseudoxanthomonas sp. NC8]
MSGHFRQYLSGTGLGPVLIRAVTGSAGLRIAGMGFGFLVGVQLARGLGAEGYGIYGVAMSVIALVMVPTEFGLPQLLAREVAVAQARQDWGLMKGILQWSSRVSLLISLPIGVGVATLLWLSGHGWGSPLGIILLAGTGMVPLVAQLSLRAAALRGLQQIVRGQLPDVLLRPMLHSLLLFLVPLWAMPLTPELAMVLGVVAATIALALAFHMLRKAFPEEAREANPVVDTRSWWSSAWPMAMTEGMRLLQAHLLFLVLAAMASLSDLGIYRVASSVVLLITMPISLFNTVSMPLIARLHARGERAKAEAPVRRGFARHDRRFAAAVAALHHRGAAASVRAVRPGVRAEQYGPGRTRHGRSHERGLRRQCGCAQHDRSPVPRHACIGARSARACGGRPSLDPGLRHTRCGDGQRGVAHLLERADVARQHFAPVV